MSTELPVTPTDPAILGKIVEAILFVAEDPVEPAVLAQATGASLPDVEAALSHLRTALEGRGLRLQRFKGQVQLVTAPEHAGWVERFLGLDLSSKLSAAALETLAIVAYRQPITRAEIDEIRGVNSSGTLRTLVQRELVQEVGRLESVGNPYQYGTTPLFLQYFGLSTLEELPPLSTKEATKLFGDLAASREPDTGGP